MQHRQFPDDSTRRTFPSHWRVSKPGSSGQHGSRASSSSSSGLVPDICDSPDSLFHRCGESGFVSPICKFFTVYLCVINSSIFPAVQKVSIVEKKPSFILSDVINSLVTSIYYTITKLSCFYDTRTFMFNKYRTT